MITKEAQEILYKFFNEKSEVIKEGGTHYIKKLYNEFIELNKNMDWLTLDSFRYRLQLYRHENGMTRATSKERFKEIREAFIKLLDANPDLLTVKHWICDYRLQDYIDNGLENGIGDSLNFVNNLRRWMNIYKMGKKIKQH